MLGVLGMSEGEERVYRAIVSGYRSAPEEIAAQLGLPVSQVEPVLQLLLDKRCISRTSGFYVPTPPDVALGPLLVDGQAELERARAAVAQLAEEYRSSALLRDSAQLVEVLTGAEAIRQQALRLQRDAREEMLWFCRHDPIALPAGENDEQFRAMERGVRYRAIYESALLDAPGATADLAAGLRAGEQARSISRLPIRLAIADRAVALCPLGAETTGEPTAALVRGTSLLVALISLFEAHWERATPLRLDSPDGDGPLHPDERELLSLLIGGMSDKSIAKQLQISPRTVQRRVHDLMRRVHARGRMQLAWQACKLGWLDDEAGGLPYGEDDRPPAPALTTG